MTRLVHISGGDVLAVRVQCKCGTAIEQRPDSLAQLKHTPCPGCQETLRDHRAPADDIIGKLCQALVHIDGYPHIRITLVIDAGRAA
jgi:hypothetical protein